MPTSRNPPRETLQRSTPFISFATSSSLKECSALRAIPRRRARPHRPLLPRRRPPRHPPPDRAHLRVRLLLPRSRRARASGEKGRGRSGRMRRSRVVRGSIRMRTGHHDQSRPRRRVGSSRWVGCRSRCRARRDTRCRPRQYRQVVILRISSSQYPHSHHNSNNTPYTFRLSI